MRVPLKHDPQEKDLEKSRLIRLARREALRQLKEHRGFCHLLWSTQKQILKEKHGIDWKSPAEMNPTIVFD